MTDFAGYLFDADGTLWHGTRVIDASVVRDGAAPDGVPIEIADRVGAAGGSAVMDALPAGGTLLRVELPCG